MLFLLVYSPSDFVGGLPIEQGAMAQGTPTFTLTLKAGATPTLIEVNDNDNIFDEVDGTQSLAQGVTLDGQSYGSGTTINTAYDLLNSSTGHKVTTFHFGGDGYQQGAVDGLFSTIPLQPGQSYTFNQERTSHRQNNEYEDYVACFASGTFIETEHGPRRVETLTPGDLIVTAGANSKPLAMELSRTLSAEDLAAKPNLAPITIAAGALGHGLPHRALTVSPQHRMLVSSPIVARLTGEPTALIAAKKLLGLPGIRRSPARRVTYHHLVFSAHEIILAEGAPTESFYPGPCALASLPGDARAEFIALIGEGAFPAARPIPTGRIQL
ncbi:MAG: Hint domain-containing protein, partial [Pseudomonadota bacterium]